MYLCSRGRLSICAALIARNEERFIGGCLESVRGLVDDIVVVDTGSEDRTRQVATQYGARVFDVPWADDFAAARNAALARARGDWILYIDADERVRSHNERKLCQLLSEKSRIAYFVQFHSKLGMTAYWEMRIFRNHPRIRFHGAMHESIWPGIRRYQLWRGGSIGYSDLVFEHLGYEGDQRHKHERNLPLLLQSLESDPNRIFYWCHLAQVYAGLGRHVESLGAWEEAVARVRKKWRVEPSDGLAFAGLIQLKIENGEDVTALLKEARERFSGNLQLDWLEARFLMAKERYVEAIPFLESLIRHGRDRDFELVAGYDERLFGELSLSSLATCYYRIGRYSEAKKRYAEAGQYSPDSLEYKVKEALCAKLEERPR